MSRDSHRGKAGDPKSRKKQGKSVAGVARTTPSDSKHDESDSPPKRKDGRFTKGDPRINRTIPGPGRPRGKFARKCRRVLNNPKTWKAVRRTIQNPDNPAMKSMWSTVADRGYGRPSSPVELQLPPGGAGEDGDERPNAIMLLMGRLDTMEKRKTKAQEHTE
jgi:hypothetical protein